MVLMLMSRGDDDSKDTDEIDDQNNKMDNNDNNANGKVIPYILHQGRSRTQEKRSDSHHC